MAYSQVSSIFDALDREKHLELFSAIATQSYTFSELKRELKIKDSTLSKKLKDLKELSLIQRDLRRGDEEDALVWTLTDVGEKVMSLVKDLDAFIKKR